MTGLAATLWNDLSRGIDAPLRILLIGMLAAFAISLPVTVAFNLLEMLPSALLYAFTGAVHAAATFYVAGRIMRGNP